MTGGQRPEDVWTSAAGLSAVEEKYRMNGGGEEEQIQQV